MERVPKRRKVYEKDVADCQRVISRWSEATVAYPAAQQGHQYGNSKFGDNGHIHMGDVHISYLGILEQTDYDYPILFNSLKFQEMDARLHNVAFPLPGTCKWILQHPQFLAWAFDYEASNHHRFLWVKGKPGSGKSTIMKYVSGWAEKQWSSRVNLFYFFNARSTQQLAKSSAGCYRSLLCQLLSATTTTHASFQRLCARKIVNTCVDDWTEVELQNLLIELVHVDDCPPLAIFIDALDEGDEDDTRRMTDFLRDLASTSPIQVCVSSRHYPNIDTKSDLSLILENEAAHGDDIDLYVQRRLSAENSGLDDLRYQIRHRSAGVFLWVVLVIPLLNKAFDKGKSKVDVLDELYSIPPDLHRLFDSILDKEQEDFHECSALLEWVLFSKRALSQIELYHAVQHARLCKEVDGNIEEAQVNKYLLACSRGLVELTRGEECIVQFIHETVRDYLLDRKVSSVYASNYANPTFEANDCHLKLAGDCLSYLLTFCEKLRNHTHISEDRIPQYPLASYAAKFWWQHIRVSSQKCKEDLLESAWQLLVDNPSNLLTWVRLYDVDERYEDFEMSMERLASALYYVTSIGMTELVVPILRRGDDVNRRGGKYSTALQAAIVNDYEDVVRMLLEHGADVNARGELGTPIQAACARHGNDTIVRMLLEHGANPRAGEGSRSSRSIALQAASLRGYETIVKLLLEYGAGVNAQGGRYGNALQAASARHGNEKVVRILLEQGADPDARGGYYGNALQAATQHDDGAIIRLLLQYGADVNAKGGKHEDDALQIAAYDGCESVVRILLEHGADVNSEGGRFGSALLAALVYDHVAVAKLLLEHGANIHKSGGKYGNALQTASYYGNETMVRTLLEHGADVNAQGGAFGNTLQAALCGGHEAVVEILLERGADVDAQEHTYGSASEASMFEPSTSSQIS